MPVNVECPSCAHTFLIPDNMDGKEVKCPRCRAGFSPAIRPPAPAATVTAPAAAAAPAVPLAARPVTAARPAATGVTAAPPLPPRAPSAARRLTRLVLDIPAAVVRQMPGQPEGVAGLSLVALAVGLVAWGLTALTHERVIGLIVSAAGLLLAAVATATLLRRNQKGLGLPVAAGIVNLQAMAFAALFTFAPEWAAPAGTAPKAGGPIEELRRAMKAPDPNVRLKAAFEVGDLARDLNTTVLELMGLLRDGSASIRAAAAEALGRIGPPARLGYPALHEAAEADPDEQVRARARAALRKVGAPTQTDLGPFWEQLKDKDALVAAAAADALRLIGAEAQPAVLSLELLGEHANSMVRVCAAHALWKIDHQTDGVLKVLRAGLKDLDPRVRGRAARALADMQGEARDAVPALAEALKDPDPQVRFKVAYALGEIGREASGKVPQLLPALEDESIKVRLYAARALWETERNPAGIPALTAALAHKEPEMRLTAAVALWTISKDTSTPGKEPQELLAAVPALSKALTDEDGGVRGHAAFTLAALGPAAAPAVENLVAGLKHEEAAFRAHAAYALGRIGPAARTATPALEAALKDKNAEVRLFAAQALWAVDNKAAPVTTLVETLTRLMQDRDGVLRAKAAMALGLMKGAAAAAVPALNEALRDGGNPALRATAAEALGKVGAAARVTYPALQELSRDKLPEVRRAATEAIKKVGKPSRADVPALQAALKSENASLRLASVVALWMLHQEGSSAVGDLAALLADKDETVRRTAPLALAAMGPSAAAAVPALEKALAQEDDELRAAVAYALGEVGEKAVSARQSLDELLRNNKKPAVRLNAAVALWLVRKQTDGVIDALAEVTEGKELDPGLRITAAQTLAKIADQAAQGNPDPSAALRTRGAEALRAAAGAEDESVRAAAVTALGGMGRFARGEILTLMLALEDPEPEVRAAAASALGKVARAEDQAKLGIRAKVAYPSLLFFSKVEQNPQARQAASEALPRIGAPAESDLGVLLEVLEDAKEPYPFRTAAAQVLGLIGSAAKKEIPRVTKLLDHDKAEMRALVAYALGDLNAAAVGAVGALARQALKDLDAGARAAAVFALGEIGPFDRNNVLPVLVQAQGDPDETVRLSAQDALRKVKSVK